LIAESESFWSVTLNSNINIYDGKDVFKKDQRTPSKVIQGHSVMIPILYSNYPIELLILPSLSKYHSDFS